MANNVKVKSKAKVSVKRTPKKPVKAGNVHKGNTGGVFNAKVSAIVRKTKKK